MKTQHFRITGMDCADCAATLEKGVGGLAGVQSCSVNFGAARLKVDFDPMRTNESAIVDRIHPLGYDIYSEPASPAAKASSQRGGVLGFIPFLFKRLDTTLAVIGGALLGVGMLAEFFHASTALTRIIFWGALTIAGFPIARSGWRRSGVSMPRTPTCTPRRTACPRCAVPRTSPA